MNLKRLEYIVIIAEEANISRAAKRLNITQSTLSQALLNEERDIGMPLFIRKQKCLELTDAGKCYIKGANEILQIRGQVSAGIQALKAQSKVEYCIGISSQAGFDLFSSKYHQFMECYPHATIRVTEGNAGELFEDLRAGRYAMILTAVDSFEQINYPHQPIKKEEIFLVAPKNYKKPLFSKHGNLNMNLIRHEKFILANEGTTMRMTTNHLFAALNIHPDVLCETGHLKASMKMISEGLGFTILPETLRMEFENVQWIPFYPRFFRSQMAVYQEKYSQDEALMGLIKLLREQ